ncbi:LysE family translocator [uncultured Hydrogenophaga sp.]|jgi:threonine/homoserine/homoserine lactone efflux protein|uniref:LysE family translocator n=1 Tax=uncultured Hydrogenophaga sp. TaxID=199683 RepID=UPI00258CAFAF|nr:LysE family translocator [uncultured Hydrogenophaga sp.]
MTEALILFAAVAFVGIATPGPTVLLALSNGSRFGVRASLPGMVGAVLSDFVLISAVALGLGALLAASEFWFSVVKWLGVAYLTYLGLRMLRSTGTLALPDGEVGAQRPSSRAVFLRSFLVAVTNPKGYLFFTAFLPQFIDPAAPQWPQYAALALTFAAIDFVVMLGYAVTGAQAIRVLRTKGVLWLDRLCGGVLLALAGSLAFYRRGA